MSISNYSRSIFLEKLVPQFVREEYPVFIDFMKKYYDFLDRQGSTLVAVRVTEAGNNYSSSPTISLQVLQDNGTYAADSLGATFAAYVINGKIDKIRVTNYGAGYSDTATYRIVITDATGTGAAAVPYIVPEIGQVNYAAKSAQYSRDIDTEFPVLYEFLRKEYIPFIPKNLNDSVEPEKFIKFIRRFYNSTGIEDSFAFVYRILYNTEPSFYYPKTDMLRVSDGRYQIDNILNINPDSPYDTADTLEDFKDDFLGRRIYCQVCKVSAVIERVEAYTDGGHRLKLYLSNINGTLNPAAAGENVYDFPVTGLGNLIGTTVFATVGATQYSYYSSDGYYLGDEGQPSSSKKIQDSFYYQDFSYEVAGLEAGLLEYGDLIEKLIHPAGLKYFIRIIAEGYADLETEAFASSDVVNWADVETYSYPGPRTVYLGPIYADKDKYKSTSLPKYVNEYLSPRLNADNSNKLFYLSDSDNERYNPVSGATAPHYYMWNRLYIMSGDGVGEFRKIVALDGATGVIEYEYPFDTAPTSSSTYYIHPDLYSGASGATGYYNGFVQSIEVLDGSTGFLTADIIVQIDEPPGVVTEAAIAGSTSAVVAGASAVISGGAITELVITNAGIGYITAPGITISSASNPDGASRVSASVELNDISNSNYFQDYQEYGGVILKCTELTDRYVNAFGYCDKAEDEDYIDNIVLGASGLGYFVPPRITLRHGNIGATSFATAISEIDANGSINDIVFGATGSGYVYNPTVFIDPVSIPSGEIVYQPTTGASGILEYYDRENDNLYILTNPLSAEFDDSDVIFNGATCVINTVLGSYITTGKNINTVPESEIVIIKQT